MKTVKARVLVAWLRSALVWGSSVRASPQECGLKHELQDEDVMQITKLTAAAGPRNIKQRTMSIFFWL